MPTSHGSLQWVISWLSRMWFRRAPGWSPLTRRKDLMGFIEIVEMNPAMKSMYAAFQLASVGWDGLDAMCEG